MAELITETQPRIKYQLHRNDVFVLPTTSQELQLLSQMMHLFEVLGATPILNDGLVAGNCGLLLSHALPQQVQHTIKAPVSPQATSTAADETDHHISQSSTVLVSRSGKPPGHLLGPADFVCIDTFDQDAWQVSYSSPTEADRPTSDTPLLHACLAHPHRYGWSLEPRVAVHGHALAEGPGLQYAAEQGIPISQKETMFSTPEDLQQLEALFQSYPYPQHKIFIRKAHGFFIVGQDMADVKQTFEAKVLPFIQQSQQSTA